MDFPDIPVVHYFLPEINAIIASQLGDTSAGDIFRKETGNIGIKSVVVKDGITTTYRNGVRHSFNDEPAVVFGNTKEWWWKGKLHREGDLPAVIMNDGKSFEWWVNGKRHREGDQPAVIYSADPYKAWYVNGVRHRDIGKGPAVESRSGYEWWRYGECTGKCLT